MPEQRRADGCRPRTPPRSATGRPGSPRPTRERARQDARKGAGEQRRADRCPPRSLPRSAAGRSGIAHASRRTLLSSRSCRCRTLAELRHAGRPRPLLLTLAYRLGRLRGEAISGAKRSEAFPELPMGQLWQSGLDSVNLGSAKDWFLPVPSHSPSSPGDYARSGRRSRRSPSIARVWRHPAKRSGRELKQAFQGSRFGSSKRYRPLLGERARQDHGKVVEGRRRPSAGQRPLSQFADNGFFEGEFSPVQIKLDHGRRNPDATPPRPQCGQMASSLPTSRYSGVTSSFAASFRSAFSDGTRCPASRRLR